MKKLSYFNPSSFLRAPLPFASIYLLSCRSLVAIDFVFVCVFWGTVNSAIRNSLFTSIFSNRDVMIRALFLTIRACA
jgi:hypothetical protein